MTICHRPDSPQATVEIVPASARRKTAAGRLGHTDGTDSSPALAGSEYFVYPVPPSLEHRAPNFRGIRSLGRSAVGVTDGRYVVDVRHLVSR